MVVVTGPLHSLTARGTFNKNLTFQRRKYRNVVYPYTIPTDPRSSTQLAQRARYTQAWLLWGSLSSGEKDAFNSAALYTPMSGFNLFMQTYLKPYPDTDINHGAFEFSDRLTFGGAGAGVYFRLYPEYLEVEINNTTGSTVYLHWIYQDTRDILAHNREFVDVELIEDTRDPAFRVMRPTWYDANDSTTFREDFNLITTEELPYRFIHTEVSDFVSNYQYPGFQIPCNDGASALYRIRRRRIFTV